MERFGMVVVKGVVTDCQGLMLNSLAVVTHAK